MPLKFQVLSITCLAVLVSETSGIVQWFKYRFGIRRLKPIDCPMCLAWWLGLFWFFARGEPIYAIPLAATCSILAILISRELRR